MKEFLYNAIWIIIGAAIGTFVLERIMYWTCYRKKSKLQDKQWAATLRESEEQHKRYLKLKPFNK